MDGDGAYDAPPSDHAWRVSVPATGIVSLPHSTSFTDVGASAALEPGSPFTMALSDGLPALMAGNAVVHNDYKYDNLVLDVNDLSIRTVLDWEMATIGDPLMDLGTTLGYWVEENDPEELRSIAFGLTMLPGNLTRDEIVELYATMSGREVSEIRFYYVYC